MYGLEAVTWQLYTKIAVKLGNIFLKYQALYNSVMIFKFQIPQIFDKLLNQASAANR